MEAVGKINCYICKKCDKYIYTINLNTGTTPFGIVCIFCYHSECYSNFYRILHPKITIEWAWYRPQIEEYRKLPRNVRDHILNGGLILGRLTNVDPINDKVTDKNIGFHRWKAVAHGLYGEIPNDN